jgi:hypothetical protein
MSTTPLLLSLQFFLDSINAAKFFQSIDSFYLMGVLVGTDFLLYISHIIQNFSKPFAVLATCFVLVSCLLYSFTQKIESTCSPKCQFTFHRLYGSLSWKIELFIQQCEKLRSIKYVLVVYLYMVNMMNEHH